MLAGNLQYTIFAICWFWSETNARDLMSDSDDKSLNPNILRNGPRYSGENANVSRVLDGLLEGYDRRLRPNYRGPPVEIGVTMYVASVSSISEVNMDYTLDFYIRQSWRDERLTFSQHLHDLPEEITISTDMLQKIWWPDTFFANAKSEKFHTVTTRNAFLRMSPEGNILLSLRLQVTAACSMDLTYFPMDSQICTLEIETFGYKIKDIRYNWLTDNPVGISTEVKLPQFKMRGHRQKTKVEVLSTGNYSRLSCEFYFVRSMGYYLIQIYLPSNLIVVLSWVSFWLSREAVPARVALGITTVLTMTTLISSTNAALPKISYLKSIDVYLVTCFVMVFAALLEYAAVSYMTHRSNRRKTYAAMRRSVERSYEPSDTVNHNGQKSPLLESSVGLQTEIRLKSMRKLHTECDLRSLSSQSPQATTPLRREVTQFQPHYGDNKTEHAQQPGHCAVPMERACVGARKRKTCCSKPSIIDKYSRIFFPSSFILFNILYWVIYLNIRPVPLENDFILLP